MQKRQIILPGSESGDVTYGATMHWTKWGELRLPVKSPGGPVDFWSVECESVLWKSRMQAQMSSFAEMQGYAPEEVLLVCPFQVLRRGQVIITEEIISRYSSQILVLAACVTREETIVVPVLVSGQVVQQSVQAISVITFGECRMHVTKQEVYVVKRNGAFLLTQDAKTVLATMQAALSTDTAFKVDRYEIVPRPKSGSRMIPQVLQNINKFVYGDTDTSDSNIWA